MVVSELEFAVQHGCEVLGSLDKTKATCIERIQFMSRAGHQNTTVDTSERAFDHELSRHGIPRSS